MHKTRSTLFSIPLLTAALCAQQVQHLVVPTAFTNTDAVSYNWLAGATRDLRQQTLVGPSHLQTLVGQELLALELRRSAANEVYQGGAANLTVVLSTAPHGPLGADSAFAGNVGADATLVFSGQVTLPTSPATTGTSVAWTANNVLRITFQTPFVYRGGTLCIDVVGQPIPGQNADWWMADAEFEDISGSIAEVGAGCGAFGGPTHTWSFASVRTLLPGAPARFWAYGPPNGFAIATFGVESPVPIPLSAFGLNAPGCSMHLQPALVLSSMVTMFEPEAVPVLAWSGIAEARVRIPADPWVFGLTLTTQWLDLTQPATSNAIRWTVANTMPSLDMALLEGHPSDARGELSVHMAHVLRFEHH